MPNASARTSSRQLLRARGPAIDAGDKRFRLAVCFRPLPHQAWTWGCRRTNDVHYDVLAKLKNNKERLATDQDLLFSAQTYALLIVLQAMDAAGKDGTIKHVMSGVNGDHGTGSTIGEGTGGAAKDEVARKRYRAGSPLRVAARHRRGRSARDMRPRAQFDKHAATSAG